MRKTFISYNRQDETVTRDLAGDLEALGHTVWFDHELSGGQAWWDQILTQIRDSDLFVFVLSPDALSSTACRREFGYAADLRKPILPVLASGEVSVNLLPPALSQIQLLDYRQPDRDAVLRLGRALTSLPPPGPLPEPLPTPPATPVSYLGALTQQVETTSALSYEEQIALVMDLKRSLREAETAKDGRALLARLRKRRDLYATVAEEIDELLVAATAAPRGPGSAAAKPRITSGVSPPDLGRHQERPEQTGPPITNSEPSRTGSLTTRRDRWRMALFGAVTCAALGSLYILLFGPGPEDWPAGVVFGGTTGAVVGAIGGKDRKILLVALVGAFLGFAVWIVADTSSYFRFIQAALFGAPIGAILFAAVIAMIKRRMRRTGLGLGPTRS